MVKVAPLISDVFVGFGDLADGPASMVRIPLATRDAPLLPAQFFLRIAKILRRSYTFACGEGSESLEAQINANGRAFMPKWFKIRKFKLEDGVPLIAHPLEDSGFNLSLCGDRSVPFDLDFANILNTKATVGECRAISKSIDDRLPTAARFKARISRLLPCLDTTKERLKCFVKAAKCSLDRRIIQPSHIFIFGTNSL